MRCGMLGGSANAGERGRALTADLTAKRDPKPKLKKCFPSLEAVQAERLLLSIRLSPDVVNRLAAFVFPLSFRPLVDKVMGVHGNMSLLHASLPQSLRPPYYRASRRMR